MKAKDFNCSADGCSRNASNWFQGKPYCNKHFLRLYNNGTIQLVGKKIKTKFSKEKDNALGITSKGTQFKFSLVDWDIVTKHSWSLSKTGYLVSRIEGKVIKLQRYVLQPESNQVVDHINGDLLDNRRENLRIISQRLNCLNHSVSKNNKLGVLGVSKTPYGKFRARIMVNRKEVRLGNYETIEEARQARIEAEKKYFGEYRRR